MFYYSYSLPQSQFFGSVFFYCVQSLPLYNTRIADDPKYRTYFADYLSALDRIYIDVYIVLEDQLRYCNRKGHLLQNVLTVCNFAIEFIYILIGQEGLVHNTAVFRDTKNNKGFTTLLRKYQLRDAGYTNSETVLILYRVTRYYLKEQRLFSLKPKNVKELFNLRYTSLQNVVERIFSVVKRKYQVLRTLSKYLIDTQTRIILAYYTLYNYVRSIEGEKADIQLKTET